MIVPDYRDRGGILHLPEAAARHPDKPLVLYCRSSEHATLGMKRSREKLEGKAHQLELAVDAVAPGRRIETVMGFESGRVDEERRVLERVCWTAHTRGAIIVAADSSRFIRPSLLFDSARNADGSPNLEAVPTSAEFFVLREMALLSPLATVVNPGLPEFGKGGRRSLATNRGKPGRRGTIDDERAAEIFYWLGVHCHDPHGRWRWERPIRNIAAKFETTPQSIDRAADRVIPGTGETWRERAVRCGGPQRRCAAGLCV